MTYFSNSTEGYAFEAKYCSKCIHHDEDAGCPVMNAHLLFQGSKEVDTDAVLEMLISSNKECQMYYERHGLVPWEE